MRPCTWSRRSSDVTCLSGDDEPLLAYSANGQLGEVYKDLSERDAQRPLLYMWWFTRFFGSNVTIDGRVVGYNCRRCAGEPFASPVDREIASDHALDWPRRHRLRSLRPQVASTAALACAKVRSAIATARCSRSTLVPTSYVESMQASQTSSRSCSVLRPACLNIER